jgi:hypothetical protein
MEVKAIDVLIYGLFKETFSHTDDVCSNETMKTIKELTRL